jgi:hypothetical protein
VWLKAVLLITRNLSVMFIGANVGIGVLIDLYHLGVYSGLAF